MSILESYSVAVFFCFVTMFCWRSWANTQKLAENSPQFRIVLLGLCRRHLAYVALLRLYIGSTVE